MGEKVFHPSGGPLMTKQSAAAATDINQIVARHIAHDAPIFADGRARYGDFSSVGDYHGALNRVMQAEEEFMRLPAAVRDHCKNDPGEFLSMVFDPARRGELEKLGLVETAVPEAAPAAKPDEAPVGAPPGAVAGS